MIAKLILDYLSDNLEAHVGMEQPKDLTGYVLIDQTRSSRTNHIITTTLAIQSYGATLYKAMLLNEEVKAVMERAIELNEVTRIELTTDYNFTDTTTKQYRWQAVYDITHY